MGKGDALKACVYCAENIADQAIVCRYCTRPVLVGVSSIAKLGTWCAAGRQSDNSFGIWNMVSGGEAIERFDGTDEGWQATMKRFDNLQRDRSGGVFGFVGVSVPLDF
jgi:hypothetical protein